MEEILVIKKIHYKNILDDLSLNIYKGTINYLSGPNNSGKSTLLKILSKNIKNFTGYVNDLNNISLITNQLEFVFDNVYDEAYFIYDNTGLDVKIRDKKVKEILTKYGYKKNRSIDTLTYYEKVKLALCLEEVRNTKVILLDNTFADLSITEVKEIVNVLRKNKLTVIICSNNLDNVLYADYLHILANKKIIYTDKVLEVLKHDSDLNKIGLELPFIIDLSLKLKYYDLTESIETNMNRLVRRLWN